MSFQPEHESVTLFRKYLRIQSVHPDINYDECVEFLTEVANDLNLPMAVIMVTPKNPIVIITLLGEDPSLPSVLLNSHMDVVPVYPENWIHPPFEAVKDSEGNIYARGSQDMKCVAIQYIETIRRYIREGIKLKRTVHMSFVPDEEIGGTLGMKKFVETAEFKKLNVGFSLDEGMANASDEYTVYCAERAIWHLTIICPGTTGHGSLLHENTAGEKVQYIINKFMERRIEEKKKLSLNPHWTVGDVTTINLTILSGGVQVNVLPTELKASFDVRVAVDVDHKELENEILKWCEEAGSGVHVDFGTQDPKMGITKLDNSNPWWNAFQAECDKMGLKLKIEVFPGGTDSRYFRNIGIPALGFSPMKNTPRLLHDHNEFLNEKVFLQGLDIYYNIIKSIASV